MGTVELNCEWTLRIPAFFSPNYGCNVACINTDNICDCLFSQFFWNFFKFFKFFKCSKFFEFFKFSNFFKTSIFLQSGFSCLPEINVAGIVYRKRWYRNKRCLFLYSNADFSLHFDIYMYVHSMPSRLSHSMRLHGWWWLSIDFFHPPFFSAYVFLCYENTSLTLL